ncbi:MAG: MxaK protein [Methylobacter sp.]|nr:MxaK protein [Methylobacter sp.]MDP2099080.1 MxaK protein [Methylobacter sp.]MDP2426625.1 MxaK protein [Methylobacter sp.]MDP3056596.1 MxaK protein [Methylobacter sp.]MDP3362598.1 MxaK protein [Methylobacter sp.]
MIRTIRHITLWAALAAGLAAFVYSAGALYGIHRDNDLIRQLISGKDVAVNNVISGKPELRLARAFYFKRKHRYDEALSTLSLIMDKGDRNFQAKVRYNLGNLYLEQAIQQALAMNINEAMPLLGLAKQAYRQSLALNSGDWDAKYNLEVAMRLLPEMDRVDMPDDEPTKQKSQLWTTVPGFPRGLP